MMKKIGKKFIFTLLSILINILISTNNISNLNAKVEEKLDIYLEDLEKKIIDYAELNKLFLIVARYTESTGSVHINSDSLMPEIKNFDDLQIINKTHKQKSIANFNNASGLTNIVIYETVYTARANNLGLKKIGPATVEKDSLKSKEYIFSVKEATNTTNAKSENIEIELFFPKDKVYVGQKVPFIIKLFMANHKVILHNIFIPQNQTQNRDSNKDTDNISWDSKLTQTKSEVKKEKGRDFIYCEISGHIYPKKAGTFDIAGVGATYSVSNSNDIFQLLLLGRPDQQNVYAPSQKLTVLPLPHGDKFINSIGDFSKYSAKIDKESIDQSSAAVITYSLRFNKSVDVDVENLALPELKLPKELIGYPSKTWVEKENQDNFVKYFDVVVHSNKPGKFKIIGQEFTFLNPDTGVIKTLVTESIDLTVKSDNSNKANKVYIEEDNKNSKDINSPETGGLEINSFSESLKNLEKKIKIWPVIPWALFFILMILPILALLILNYRLCFNFFGKYFPGLFSNIFLRRQFRILRKQIKNLEQNKKDNFSKLYLVFKKALSNIFSEDKNFILTDAQINQKIAEVLSSKDSETLQIAWKKYYAELLHLSDYTSSSKDNLTPDYINKIFKEAESWVNILSKKNKKFRTLMWVVMLLSQIAQSGTVVAKNKLDQDLKETLTQGLDLKKLYKYGTGLCKAEYLSLREELALRSGKENLISNNLNNLGSFFDWLNFVPIFALQILFLIIWSLLFLLIYRRRFIFFLISIILVISVGFLLYQKTYNTNIKEGLINLRQANLYIGPGLDYPKSGNLFFLDEVIIIADKDEWTLVKSADQTGWVKTEDISRV